MRLNGHWKKSTESGPREALGGGYPLGRCKFRAAAVIRDEDRKTTFQVRCGKILPQLRAILVETGTVGRLDLDCQQIPVGAAFVNDDVRRDVRASLTWP